MTTESTTETSTNVVLEGNPAALGLPVFIAGSIALGLGLTHNWFAITAGAAVRTQALILITWLVIIVLLTVSTLRLPLAFTAIFVLVDLALVAVSIGTLNGSSGWLKLGGLLAFLFAAVGAYVYVGVAATATGGRSTSLGRPVLGG